MTLTGDGERIQTDKHYWYASPKGGVHWVSVDDILDDSLCTVHGVDMRNLTKSENLFMQHAEAERRAHTRKTLRDLNSTMDELKKKVSG